MAPMKSSTWSRHQLVAGLIMLTMCYQLIYNVMLFEAVEKDAGQDECSAPAGVGNSDSPHCLEVRLFNSWREAEVNKAEETEVLPQRAEESVHEEGSKEVAATVAPSTAIKADGVNKQSVLDSMEAQKKRIQHRHELFDQLETSIRKSLNTSSNTTPWAEDLVALQEHLQSEMTSQEAVRERKAKMTRLEQSVRASLESRPSHMTPWAENLVALQKHLEEEDHAHHVAAEARHARAMMEQKNVTSEISERMTNLEKHLANLISERKEWEGRLLKRYGAPEESTTAKPKSFLEKQLHWSSVVGWSKTSWRPEPSWSRFMSEKNSVVLRREARHMHWSGAIPKVACVTAIEGSPHTKARMMYFVNNFRLQDYEGPRELVFVYHHSDTMAAELVQKYADGTYIKGVAAFGDKVPSQPALRYGAWSSDADVIARWDFEEWHDPSRLSMQIRAMAMASRPACVIRLPHDSGKSEQGHAFSPSSLAGERLWINKHWHPLDPEEARELETSEAARVVELDMQNDRLAGNITHIKEVLDGASQETPNHTSQRHEWSTSECLEFDQSKSSVDDGHSFEGTLSETVGPDLSKQFHKLMTRRHDITQKLQLLCLQSTIEKDARKQVFMRQHVDQMAGIRAELDKHIAAMKELFAPA